MNIKKIRGIILALSAGIMWSFSGTCGQFIFSRYTVSATVLTAIRMLISGLILCILLFLTKRKKMFVIFKSKKDILRLIVFAVCGFTFCQVAYLTAIEYSNAGTATTLQYIASALVLVYMCIRNARKPDSYEVIAIFLSLLGTFLIASHGHIHTISLTMQGLFWGLISSWGYFFYLILPDNLVKKYDSWSITGYGLLIGGIVLCLITEIWKIKIPLDMTGYIAFTAIIIFGTIIPFPFIMQSIKDIGPIKASLLACIEPVSATVLSAVWLHTIFSLYDIIGMICILSTVIIVSIKKKPISVPSKKSHFTSKEG